MQIRVYLANRYPSAPVSGADAVVYIVPSANKWNDFGYSLMVELVVQLKETVVRLSTGVKSTINGAVDTSAYLEGLSSPVEISTTENDGKFATFLGRKDNYLQLLAATSPDVAREILIAIRDIAAYRLFAPDQAEFQTTLESDAVQKSFLRTSEAYLTFIGLKKLFVVPRAETIGAMRITELEFLETVSDSGSLMTLTFAPDLLGENLIHAIIGRNGLGKTRLLMDVASTLSGLPPSNVSLDAKEWVSALLKKSRQRVVVLTHEPDRWTRFHESNVKILPLNVFGSAWTNLGQPLFDLARSSAADNSDFSWTALRRIARGHLPIEKLHFPRRDGTYVHWSRIENTFAGAEVADAREFDATQPIAFIDGDGQKLDISSGQKVILNFLTRLFDEAHDQTVYLFDEPEVHLHPQFISLVMLALYDALSATRSVAVLATHSPYVVRELDKSCVTVLRPSKADGVDFARPTLQTRGGNIGAISEFVFEHSNAESLTRSRLLEFVMDRGTGIDKGLLKELAGLVGSEGINRIPGILAEGDDAKLPE
ncbi:AAA family ATPase [Massilia psychrophila]|uniref:ATPase AAA-type core domain-containing protein n=1 Tax=Massilia psychrophila TaxID=1603353 RepID=A0A2G8SX40_9BURK|nr:AAA family ATPase [Massilia psychrophila]PIL38334.1 hypothetical protein CR103_18645 [Massilia psychrophila]GGE83722.1 hypothetical protein GCM10008020_30750 [Massilia psychrophila]